MPHLSIFVTGSGDVVYLHDDDVHEVMQDVLDQAAIRRASYVEPQSDGRWYVDFAPIGLQITLGPFRRRADALAAEREYLETKVDWSTTLTQE